MINKLDDFIQIIDPMDNSKVTRIKQNEMLSFCENMNYYPITVKVSAQQLNDAKEICNNCKTSLITLLSETINNIYHLSETNKELKVTNPVYQFYYYACDLNILDCKITNYHSSIKTIDKIMTDSNITLNAVEDILNKFRLNNSTNQNQLIIFKSLNNNTYEELSNLDNKLQKLNITAISNIFQELINAILDKKLIGKPYYNFTVTNKNNIPKLIKELNKGSKINIETSEV